MARKAITFEDLVSGKAGKNKVPLTPIEKYELEFSDATFLLPLQKKRGFRLKKMFGGLAVYLNTRLLLILANDPEQKEWKGKKYKFPLWDGLLVCTDHRHQEALINSVAALISHPVLGKWLFLSRKKRSYKKDFHQLVGLIAKGNRKIGVKSKKPKKSE